MTCIHLQQLYQLCREHDIKVSSSDVVRLACGECQQSEVCPAILADEYDLLDSTAQQNRKQENGT